jgi:hypothetical protein
VETSVHLSFLTGIRGETIPALRRNLETALRVGQIEGVMPIVIWQILYERHSRGKAVTNYIIPFMFMLNFIPERMELSLAFMKDILALCIAEPFFDFLCMTESSKSLELMQQLVIFLKSNPQQRTIKDYERLLHFQGGGLTKLILKSRSLEELNSGVLSMVGI